MALDKKIKKLLNDMADSMPALRLPDEPYEKSNPKLGDVLEDEIYGGNAVDQTARDLANTAQNRAYTPAVLANWSGTAPTSIKNALDRIAAALGPIT
jgi:hypothetical protein